MMRLFDQCGISVAKNFPVDDLIESVYSDTVFQAAQYLNDMVNNKHKKVFVYCKSGITRSSTVIQAYLCLFKKIKDWSYVTDVQETLVQKNSRVCPNVEIVQKVVDDNLTFQDKQSVDEIEILTAQESYYGQQSPITFNDQQDSYNNFHDDAYMREQEKIRAQILEDQQREEEERRK